MATQAEGFAQGVIDHHDEQQTSNRPKICQRKSSFSEALTKFTSNTFNRRRTTTGISNSNSSNGSNHHSRIPTPAGIDRSTSFFSTVNTFASKSTVSMSEESPQPPPTKRSRKISERLAQTPFFSQQHQQQSSLTPLNNRESSIKIEQRGLMQPVHPPLPRSTTIGNLGQSQQSSPHTPSFMRPTTSSARRSSGMGRSNTAAPSSMAGRGSVTMQRHKTCLRPITGSKTPSKTPTQAHQGPADAFPTRSDNLVPAPRMTDEPGPTFDSETMPTDFSDGANFGVTDQHAQDMPVAKENSNGKPEVSADHMHETRRAAPAIESKKGILKSKNKNRKLSEVLSNLYVDEEADTSKEEHDSNEIESYGNQSTSDYSERTASPESSNPRLIHEAQPSLWWLGRYTALSDRFRTGTLPSPPSSPSGSHSSATNDFSSTVEPYTTGLNSGSSSNANHPMHDTDRRKRRVYVHLRSLCTTDEARASLDEFKGIMEAREKKMMAGPQGKAVKQKQGWLEGLMGKKKRGEK